METSKNMIRNLVYIVERYGFIPNGGRVYYLRRSQPPLLTGMVYEYYEATRDTDFILEVLPVLEKVLSYSLGDGITIWRFRNWRGGSRIEWSMSTLTDAIIPSFSTAQRPTFQGKRMDHHKSLVELAVTKPDLPFPDRNPSART